MIYHHRAAGFCRPFAENLKRGYSREPERLAGDESGGGL